MANYYKKTEYVEAITEHLASEGKRMTNLKKASISQLHSMALDKFNIDMDTFVDFRKKCQKQKAKDAKADREFAIAKAREQEEIYKKEDNKVNDFKRTTHMDLNVIKNKWLVQEQLQDTLWAKDNQETIQKRKKDADDFKNRLAKSLGGVVNETGFIANGVQVECLGLGNYTSRDRISTYYNERKTLLMLSNLNINEEVDYDSDESELVVSSDSDSD